MAFTEHFLNGAMPYELLMFSQSRRDRRESRHLRTTFHCYKLFFPPFLLQHHTIRLLSSITFTTYIQPYLFPLIYTTYYALAFLAPQ